MPNSTFWGWRWCCIAMRTCFTALTMSLHCVNDLRTIQERWGKSSEWVKWHGWQYQDVQDPTSTCLIPCFWAGDGAIAMRTCYSALTALHCVDDLSTIQEGWGKSSEWVKWHGCQYQAVQDPNYMSNFTFWVWGWRWSRIAMWTCYSALTVPVLENLFSKQSSLTLRCFKGENIVIVVIISYLWQFFQNGKITRYSHVLCSFQLHDQIMGG